MRSLTSEWRHLSCADIVHRTYHAETGQRRNTEATLSAPRTSPSSSIGGKSVVIALRKGDMGLHGTVAIRKEAKRMHDQIIKDKATRAPRGSPFPVSRLSGFNVSLLHSSGLTTSVSTIHDSGSYYSLASSRRLQRARWRHRYIYARPCT